MNPVVSFDSPAQDSAPEGVAYAAVMERPTYLPVFVTRDGDRFRAHAEEFGATAEGPNFVDVLVKLESALRPSFPDGAVPPFDPTGPAAEEDYPESERLADIEIWDDTVAAGEDPVPIEQLFVALGDSEKPND